VRYGDVFAVAGVDLDVHAGQVLALMGRNGSGKTSLLWALQGSGPRQSGTVALAGDGADPARLAAGEVTARIGLVPQSPGDLLYLSTVAAECAVADGQRAANQEAGSQRGQPPGACRALLDRIVPGVDDDAHPRDLSEGQRLALALAVQLCSHPLVVMLDEPTRGLDEGAKIRFAAVIKELASEGRAIVVATHDVEFVANVADRVVVLAEGEVVADGPTADVVVASPIFAPQVAKVMRPARWLTVGQITRAIAAEGSR
jgi:energy-coupling factor transport system ATP-binding protein